jgi:hypothetical protein
MVFASVQQVLYEIQSTQYQRINVYEGTGPAHPRPFTVNLLPLFCRRFKICLSGHCLDIGRFFSCPFRPFHRTSCPFCRPTYRTTYLARHRVLTSCNRYQALQLLPPQPYALLPQPCTAPLLPQP